MPYLCDKIPKDTRKQIIVDGDSDFRALVKQAAARWNLGTALFAGVALLAFSSLDQEDKIKGVLQHRIPVAKRDRCGWGLPVPAVVHAHIDKWSFPLFTRGEVARAAILLFMGLLPAEQNEWILEFYVFISNAAVKS